MLNCVLLDIKYCYVWIMYLLKTQLLRFPISSEGVNDGEICWEPTNIRCHRSQFELLESPEGTFRAGV